MGVLYNYGEGSLKKLDVDEDFGNLKKGDSYVSYNPLYPSMKEKSTYK